MANKEKKSKSLFFYIVTAVSLVILLYLAKGLYKGAMSIQQLLTENKHLKQAITNLTQEEQIGYAKVIAQQIKDGELFTTIRFVETDRNDKLKTVLEKDYVIQGDIIHFDALIVKFGDKMVMDGTEKSLYLWRRVYGETTAPKDGFAIEKPGEEPTRYNDLLKLLPQQHKELFWTNIWELANNPDKLQEHDITAIYGNVVYSRLRPGLIYIFKISSVGQLYPEVVLDI